MDVPRTTRRWRDLALWDAAPAGERVLWGIFSMWVLAFLLKHSGASWDVAWHFRYLRDDLIPPHILNLSGNAIVLALTYFQFRTGLAVEVRGFLIIVVGFVLFVVAIPLDLLNHRLFGLDVTIWSVPHLMFFFGSTIALCGLLRMWLRLAAPGRWKTIYTFIFLTLLMDCAIFLLGQQEYGVLSVDAYLRGHPTASDDLLALAHGEVARFATGNVPAWVYPVWMVLSSTIVFVGARRAQPGRWTATIVAALYLAYRGIIYALLMAASFPPSFIPVMLLGAGLVVDIAERQSWRRTATAGALLLVFYGGAGLIGQVTLMPAFSLATAPVVVVPLWAIVALGQASQRTPDRLSSTLAQIRCVLVRR